MINNFNLFYDDTGLILKQMELKQLEMKLLEMKQQMEMKQL